MISEPEVDPVPSKAVPKSPVKPAAGAAPAAAKKPAASPKKPVAASPLPSSTATNPDGEKMELVRAVEADQLNKVRPVPLWAEPAFTRSLHSTGCCCGALLCADSLDQLTPEV